MRLASALPPLVAYRTDLTALGTPTLGDAEARWLTVAVQLEQLSRVEPRDRGVMFDAIREIVDEPVGSTASIESLSPAVRRLTSTIEDSGALHLAHSIITRWLTIGELSILERGRSLAVRARLLRQLDARDQANDLYLDVEKLGQEHQEPELLASASIGRAALAQLRGNYPEVRRLSEAALSHATEAGVPRLMFWAHHGLLVAAAVGSDFDSAVSHAWASFQLAKDDDSLAAEALMNLSQLLADIGYPRAALAGFAAALQRRPPLRIELPTLGGAAVSSARLSQHRLIDRLANRADDIDSSTEGFTYSRAACLLEIAIAYDIVGKQELSERYRMRVQTVALDLGFHELALTAESLATRSAAATRNEKQRSRLNAESNDIVESVEALADPLSILALR